nr:hypothetical protein [uncultured Oscillibacter sp.]
MSRPGDREGERAFAKAEVVSITVTGKAGAAAPVTTNVTIQPGKENGADASSSGAVIDSTGAINVNFSLKAPEWVPAGAAMTVGYQIKVNGATMKTVAPAAFTDKVGNTLSGYVVESVADALSGVTLSGGEKVEILITSIAYDKVSIKYVDASGTDITDKMASGTSMAADTTPTNITIKYPSTDASNFPVISVVSGLTAQGTITQPNALTGGVTANGSIAGYTIKGTEEVVIKIDATQVTPSFSLSLGDAVTGTLTLADFGVPGTTDSTKTTTLTLGSNKNSLTAGVPCVVTLGKVSGLADSFKYMATITLDDGQTFTKELDKTGTSDTTFSVEVTKDTVITGLAIEVTPKLTAAAVLDGTNKLEITFSTPVKASTVTAANLGITAGTNTQNADDVIDVVVAGDGLSATVTVANAAKATSFKAGTITLTVNIESAADAANKTTAVALITIA